MAVAIATLAALGQWETTFRTNRLGSVQLWTFDVGVRKRARVSG